MDEIIGISLIVILSSVTLTALLSVLIYIMPARMEKMEQTVTAHPKRTFLIGLVNGLFFGILAAWFAELGEVAGLLAGLILLSLLGLTAVGLSSIVHLLRGRIYPTKAEGIKVTMKTAVLLIIGALTPVVGWFVLTPLLLFVGLGAAITTIMRRK